MKTYCLNGSWQMTDMAGEKTSGEIPGSVYSFLLNAGKIEDPYYRTNEEQVRRLMEEDYIFTRTFDGPEEVMRSVHSYLVFEGIDTLAEVYLNGEMLGKTDNMHIAWEFDVKGKLKAKDNLLCVKILSPIAYIKRMDEAYHLGGSQEAMAGFSHLRKAHCMFGWDWGPRLPDGGIWKDVRLIGFDTSRILDVRIRQTHLLKDGGKAFAQSVFGEEHLYALTDNEAYCGRAKQHTAEARSGTLKVELTVSVEQSGHAPVHITLVDPDGNEIGIEEGKPVRIAQPQLWWPNGLGEQPLYTVRVSLQDGISEEKVEKRIGLRTITMRRLEDRWGESFATEVNGQTFFAMGADYIPEDNILSRCTEEKTRDLLQTCKDSHFNVIRVWGGGYYPVDWFYDLCDEMGLVVWQDLMFACAHYPLTDWFIASIQKEIQQNVRRLRHHASLGLWCGNNEMESFVKDGGFECTEINRADYLIQNEYIIPQILKQEDPDTFYWPSSPSSGGKLMEPQDPNRGDVHYWSVWHGGVPFTEYRKHCFRYLSEFGFQSFPGLETIKSFTEPEDRNIFSYVMEMHQRNAGANGKIMQYLSQTYQYPHSFELVLYASQLLQAEAIRYGVEHFRRHRSDDRCMGAVYWQLNDIWPVASWASVDYYHRWKALQYEAVRFFAPVMISCEETSLSSQHLTCISEPGKRTFAARLCVTNETWEDVEDRVLWELRDADSSIVMSGEEKIRVPSFSSVWLQEMDFSAYTEMEMHHLHLSYRLEHADSRGTVLFVPPKHYAFKDPHLDVFYDEEAGLVKVTADAYAKSVEVYSPDGYVRLEDNFFDMEKGSRVLRVIDTEGDPAVLKTLAARSVRDIK